MQFDPALWPRISSLLDRLLEVPQERRETWLDGLKGEDAALAPQLRTMLRTAVGADCAAWLDTLPKIEDTALLTVLSTGAPDARAGDLVGPYRLVRRLGQGGMGSVWYAERSDQLVRRGVALKLPLVMGNNAELAARFGREREIVSRLVHPHIARLYDAGITESGQGYLALEYVEGKPLDAYCDAHRLDLRARINLFAQVLDAVQYAHSRLIIHRDLKPGNILVTEDGQIRLLDFGVAKFLEDGAPEATATAPADDLTRIAPAAMTLAYASPEQVAGKAVTTASDIYSLGIILFELLAGRRPYRVSRKSRAALEEAILQGDIPLASTVPMEGAIAEKRSSSVKRLRRSLHGDLDAILLKALNRHPQHRYATVASFGDDLGRFLDGRAVQAHRRSRFYQFRKFVGRNRVGVAATCATAATLIAISSVALWQRHEAQRQAALADAERDRAVLAARHREAVDSFMSDLLLEAGRTGKPVSIPELIASADRLSAKEFATNREARAAVLQTVADYEYEYAGYQNALPYVEQAAELLQGSQDADLRAHVACAQAEIRGYLGQARDAEQAIRSTMDEQQTSPTARLDCAYLLANLEFNVLGESEQAAALVDAALDDWARAPNHSPHMGMRLKFLQARAATQNNLPGKAVEEAIALLKEMESYGREQSHLAKGVRNELARAAYYSGSLLQALQATSEAIGPGDGGPQSSGDAGYVHYYRSMVLTQLGRYGEALRELQVVQQAAASTEPLFEHVALLDEAAIAASQGRLADAEHRYGAAIAISSPRIRAMGNKGQYYAQFTRAQLDLAEHHFPASIAALDGAMESAGNFAPKQCRALQLRALARLRNGDAPAAQADAQRSLQICDGLRGAQAYSYWSGQAHAALAQALVALNRPDEARDELEAAIEHISHSAGSDHPSLPELRARLRQLTHG